MNGLRRALIGCVFVLLMAAGLVVWMNIDTSPAVADGPPENTPASVERGRYLALIGHCAGCHTAPGGAAYAGGQGITTPFGTLRPGNLTPDMTHGLGGWTVAQFARALRAGRSADGRLLYPAFPYEHFSLLTDADVRALYDYFQSLPAAAQANVSHDLSWPYNTQAALAVWRALFFRPKAWTQDAQQSPAWNRGAYLVQAVAHCGACHTPRNALGASVDAQALGGGVMMSGRWLAPSLRDPQQAGVQSWTDLSASQILRSGASPQGSVMGPMASVVMGSLQHLRDDDAAAMATYLRSLPRTTLAQAPAQAQVNRSATAAQMQSGEHLYKLHCKGCHGAQGEGQAQAYAALAGSRKVLMPNPANLVQVVWWGGFGPSTPGQPRPYGMPPFVQLLSNSEVADVITYVRQSWGNAAEVVSAADVQRLR